jgi:hypothetical protein
VRITDVKFEPVNGVLGAPKKDTAREPVHNGDLFGRRRKVAVPEKGGGGVTIAAVRRESNSKSEGQATTKAQRKIKIGPFLSVELATKPTRPSLRPVAATAKPNALCAVVAFR